MGMCIEIFDRQRFHMGKQIVPQIPQNTLRHINHNTVVDISRCHADQVKPRYPDDRHRKWTEIGRLRCQHRLDMIVDQALDKHGSLHIRQHTDKDQDRDNDQVRSIAFRHIFHQTFKNFPWIFH